MPQKKRRQTFEKLKREQAVREKRIRKEQRKEAARLAKDMGAPPVDAQGEEPAEADATPDLRTP